MLISVLERSKNAAAKAVEAVLGVEEKITQLRSQKDKVADPTRGTTLEEIVAQHEEEENVTSVAR